MRDGNNVKKNMLACLEMLKEILATFPTKASPKYFSSEWRKQTYLHTAACSMPRTYRSSLAEASLSCQCKALMDRWISRNDRKMARRCFLFLASGLCACLQESFMAPERSSTVLQRLAMEPTSLEEEG